MTAPGRLGRRAAVAASIALVMASAHPALGQARDPAAADVLFREGRRAMQAGAPAVACPKFHESYRLDPAPGTLLNMGDCEEKLGRIALAWQFFRDAERRLGADTRAAIARQRWKALEARLAFVTFTLPPDAPAETRVVRDDVELTAAALGVALPIEPGPHVVRVRAPGRSETTTEIELKSGERTDVLLSIGAPLPTSARPPLSDRHGPARNDERRPSVLPWVAFGAAGVGLVAMGIGAWQVLETKAVVAEQCAPSGECSQAGLDAASNGRVFSAIGTIGGAVFVAGAAAGTYLLLTSGSARSSVRAGGAPLPGGFALSASSSF